MTSFAQLLDPIPVTLVFVGFMIAAIIASEIGFRIGRWWQRRSPGEQEGPTEMLVGSILTMLAFLLAVTMGMASDRFDTRHELVGERRTRSARRFSAPDTWRSRTGKTSRTCCASTCRSES